MIRTVYFASHLPRATADALNAESGRIYSQVLVEQYRIYRKKGIWLSPGAQERYNDYLNRDNPNMLHAHSTDAAQQGFAKACKTTKAGLTEVSAQAQTLSQHRLEKQCDPSSGGWAPALLSARSRPAACAVA